MVFRIENVSYGEGEGNEKKFFLECSDGEHSTHAKLSWTLSKKFCRVIKWCEHGIVKIKLKIFPASPNGGNTTLLE